MPATEQTWRDQKRLHLVFGVSAVVMLVATVWMYAKDHTREWKTYQYKTNDITQWYTAARIVEVETATQGKELTEARLRLDTARTAPLDPNVVQAFKEDVAANGADADFAKLDEQLENLTGLAQAADAARKEARQAMEHAESAIAAASQAEAEGAANAEQLRQSAREAVEARDDAREAMIAARDAAVAVRQSSIDELQEVVRRAKFKEDNLAQARKFAVADQTATVSLLGLAIGEGAPPDEIAERQAEVDAIKERVAELTQQYQDISTFRRQLESHLRVLQAEVDEAQKGVDELVAEQNRLQEGIENLWNATGRTILGMPVLDAFDTSDVHIDQIWLPDLTINYNFSDVARFDRCISCHRSIRTAAPGTGGTGAAYPHTTRLTISLATPQTAPPATIDEQGNLQEPTLRDAYGFSLAEKGILTDDDVTVQVVWPETLAADAGLQMGDVIEQIGGVRVLGRKDALNSLLADVGWGSPLRLSVRRGLPHPYATHPRLDLYLSDASPHKMGDVGCTICHDGQGSATAFKWASHTPDSRAEATRWTREHGWFDNHHWIFPMNSKRFVESGCLKCHHEVVELEPSQRFPEPPAAKLMAGYDLIRRYGCFGCHEINGYDGPDRRVGPDMRSEPNFHAVAHALITQAEGLSEQEQEWAARLVHHPEDNTIRRRLFENIDEDQNLAREGKEARLSSSVHKLASLLKDVESPGKLRRVGPSLIFLDSKVDYPWLYSWVRQPSDFRPSTRMPQFFGLWDHLPNRGHGDIAEDFEPLEIQGIAEYLLAASSPEERPFEYLRIPDEVTESPSGERGKHLFQVRGCLACHKHADFPEITADQGPDLSRMAGKLTSQKSQEWLYTWIRQPSRYHFRTKMPDLFLDPIEGEDGAVSDPAADIAAFLLQTPEGEAWEPTDIPSRELGAERQQALYDLALDHLASQYPKKRAEEYLANGIQGPDAAVIKGDEIALAGQTTDANRVGKLLQYVGRRAISKYGCSGCHDIPGFEAAKPIGTGLADWGRKEASKLAFEQIARFLEDPSHGHYVAGHVDAADVHSVQGAASDAAQGAAAQQEGDHAEQPGSLHAAEAQPAAANGLSTEDYSDPDTQFFLDAIGAHNRIGFLWQKLRQPRSYDHKVTKNKGYNERLRMPRFPFDATEREQVMTFVLGLVSEPPPEQYLYQPDPRQSAIVEGRKVLDKFNCAGCHTLDMQRWEFDYHEDQISDPATIVDYPFLEPHFTTDAIEDSLKEDRRGMRHAVLNGMPVYNEETGKPERIDEDGVPLGEDETDIESYYSFVLWENELLNGLPRPSGIQNVLVPTEGLKQYPYVGGDLARYLFPVVIADEKKRNPQVKGSEAWGWLPPPLVGQGHKVQTTWMHDFLLEPYPIRPAVVMRMPKFNMTSDEATKLANYFAARDDAAYPYEHDPTQETQFVSQADQQPQGTMADALQIVVDGNYCVKCHLVGDYRPPGNATALAPDLADVYRRLRPEYTRDWIANPKRILPYTGMPVNIPYKPDQPHLGGVSQDLYPGTSVEQLDGLVDLLMHYDQYTGRQVKIAPLIKPAPGADGGEPAAGAGPADEAPGETAPSPDAGQPPESNNN